MYSAMTALFLFFMFIAVVVYALMVFRWWIAWLLSTDRNLHSKEDEHISVSVIIAVRNERKNINTILKNLLQQDYNPSLMEIIFSDDYSIDGTTEAIEVMLKQWQGNQIRVRVLTAVHGDAPGKKAALTRGMEAAQGTLIITTDADCTMRPQWVRSYVTTYQESRASIIAGFVIIDDIKAPWQALEFLSLSGSGTASLLTGKPLMCNGANLAFVKKDFLEVGGYDYGGHLPGGDDTFLMLSMRKHYGSASVTRNPFRESVVATLPATNINEFIHQRVRWAQKISAYREHYIQITGALMYFTNLILIITLIGSLTGWISLTFTLATWLVKGIADGLLLWRAARFAGQEYLLSLILPAMVLYPFYLTAAGIIMLFRRHYQWKGRDHKK